MNPFFFGSRERALYGVYHPPRVQGRGRGPVGREGVVLCYPFGVEYMRAHRAFRQLTTLLTRQGLHVLRFDYYGTGDSMGEGSEADLAGWTGDVGTAIQELRDTAGLARVGLIGLRLGGALAARAAVGRDDVDRLVLWDPVVSGSHYLASLPGAPFAGGFPAGVDAVGVGGFPVTRSFYQQLHGFELDTSDVPARVRVELITSRRDPEFDRLRERLAVRTGPQHVDVVPSEGNWAEGDAFGSALLPQGIIQAIVDRFSGVGSP